MGKIQPITRSVSVSKKVGDIWMVYGDGVVEVYKKNRKVVTLEIKDFAMFKNCLKKDFF